MDNEEKLMSPADLAQYLNMAERTIYQWATQQKVPAIKVGASWRFKRVEIDAWLEANHSGPKYQNNGSQRPGLEKSRYRQELNEKEYKAALKADCLANVIDKMEEWPTRSTFPLDFFDAFPRELVEEAATKLDKAKIIKLNKKFKDVKGQIITVIERR